MDIEREVKISAFTEGAVEQLCIETNRLEVQKALGYLSSWCIDSNTYPKVYLFVSAKEQEITATYYKADGKVGYVIGAVWHGEHFGFHS